MARESVKLGGLMTYTADVPDLVRHAANDIGHILGRANPGDIPFYQPKKFNLIINLNTAKALGIELPPSFIAEADEVIE
jgi:putative ABC transport system substrate-binding protein